jgi:hypothetical protein
LPRSCSSAVHERQQKLRDAIGEHEPPALLILESFLGERQPGAAGGLEWQHGCAEGALELLRFPDGQRFHGESETLRQREG